MGRQICTTMNKKGSILDFFVIIPIVFLLGICIFVAFIILNTAGEVDVFTEDADAASYISITRNTILTFDNMMLFTIVGLSLFVLVSSALVWNHPAFFIVSFILLCIAVMVAAVMSNAWWTFSNQNTIVDTAVYFPKIKFLFENLPLYIAFMGIASMIAGFLGYQRSG